MTLCSCTMMSPSSHSFTLLPSSTPASRKRAIILIIIIIIIISYLGLEKCARICLKRGSVQSKMHVQSTFENDIKELDPRKVYKYLGIEESFDTQHKNEKEKLKKEYLRRLRLVLSTELSAKNKIQQLDHWQYQ